MHFIGLLLCLLSQPAFAGYAYLSESIEPSDGSNPDPNAREEGDAPPDAYDEVFAGQRMPVEELLTKSGDLFTESQKDIIDIAFEMSILLQEKQEELLLPLGEQRIAEIKVVLQKPEKNSLQRTMKNRALNRLGYFDLTKNGLTLDAEGAAIRIGSEVYRTSVIRGKDLDLFQVSRTVKIKRAGVPTDFQVVVRPTSVDGIIFPIVNLWNHDSGLAIILKPKEISEDSRHFRRFWARKVLYANSGTGLPTVSINTDQALEWEVSPETLKYRFHSRAKKGGMRLFWDRKFQKLWADANGKTPGKPALRLAGLSVVIGTAVATGTAILKCSVLPDGFDWGQFDWPLIFTTAGHTAIYSAFGSFFNNITSPHDPLNKLQQLTSAGKRAILNTAIFYYTYQIISAHGFSTLDITTMAGLITHSHVWVAALTVNGIRSVFRTIELARDEMGLSRGTERLFGQDFPKPQLEKQIYFYYPLKFLQMAELTGLPGAKELFYSAYFWLQPGVIAYLKKLGYRRADVLEVGWWNWRSNLAKYVGSVTINTLSDFANAALRAAQLLFIDVKRSCKEIAENKRIHENNPYNFGPFEQTQGSDWLRVKL